MVYFVFVKLKITNLFTFLLLTISAFSQEKTNKIQGKIYSSDNVVPNVHVYNITKKIGAISNDLGEFELRVSLNDTLYISSLQFEKVKTIVTIKNMEAKQVFIELMPLVYKLDEVFLRHLTGDLNFDMRNKPLDTIPKHNFVIKANDFSKVLPYDSYSVDKRPNAQEITDPIGKPGGGASLPDKRYQQLLKLKRELAQKKEFPETIKKELGIDYFTANLNIKKENINHFLSYCEYRDHNIIFKYYNNKVLEVIEILNEESKNYNAIKN